MTYFICLIRVYHNYKILLVNSLTFSYVSLYFYHMLEPLKLDNHKFQHRAHAYDSLNHQLYHLVDGRVESIDTKTHQKHQVHLVKNHLQNHAATSCIYPRLIKVKGQVVFNTQKTIVTNLSAEPSIVRSNVPIKTNSTWTWHIPHSLYDVKLGVMKQSEKGQHEYITFDLKASTSRTVTFTASQNSVQVWVNGTMPSKNSQKKVQLNSTKWYAFSQILQKGNTIVFTPFSKINNQFTNYFNQNAFSLPTISQCHQKEVHSKITLLQQLSFNKLLVVSSDNQANIVFRNLRTNKFDFPKVCFNNGNVHGLFTDFQKQLLKQFYIQSKLGEVKWQTSYKVSQIYQVLKYLINSATKLNKTNTVGFQILLKKLGIIRPHLSESLSNLIFELNLDEENYSQASKYFPDITRSLQIEKQFVLNQYPSCKIQGKVVEITQNYLLALNEETVIIYHLGNYVKEVYKQNIVFFEFNKNAFLNSYDQAELSALKKGSNSSIYKLLSDCLHKDKKITELFQVREKDMKQLTYDYKIVQAQARLALQQTGSVDDALVWLSKDVASRQYIGKHPEKVNEQSQEVVCSMIQLNHPLAKILLLAKNNLYLLGLNPKSLTQFYRKTDKQIVNLVDFKREWALENVNSQKWFSSRNHQTLNVLDLYTFKENLSVIAYENSQIIVVKNQEEILMKSAVQIKYNLIFESSNSIGVSEFNPFDSFIDAQLLTKSSTGQLIHAEGLKKQFAPNTTVFSQGTIYTNSNLQTQQFVDIFVVVDQNNFTLPIKSKQQAQYVPLLIEKGPPGCNLNYPICSILYPKSAFLANYPHEIKFKHLHSKCIKIQSVQIQRLNKRKNVNEAKGGHVYFQNECGLRSKKYHFVFEENEESKEVKINENNYWKYMIIQPEYNNGKKMPYEIGFVGAKGTSVQYETFRSSMAKFLEKSITAQVSAKNAQVRVQNFQERKDRLLKLKLKIISQPFKTADLKITSNANIESFYGLTVKNQIKSNQNNQIKDLDQLSPKNFNKLFIQNRNIQYLIIKEIVKLDNFSFANWDTTQIRKFVDLVFGKINQLKEDAFSILLDKILQCPQGKKYFIQICHDIGKCYISFPHQYLNCIIKKIEPLQLKQNLRDLLKCVKKYRSQRYNAIRQKKIPYLILEEDFYSKYYLQKIDELQNNSALTEIYDEDLISTNQTLVLKDDLSRRIIVKLDGKYSVNQIVLRLDKSDLSSRINFKLYKISQSGQKVLITKNRILEHQWIQMTKFPYKNQMKQMFKSNQTILNAFGIDIKPFETKYIEIQIAYTQTGITGLESETKNIPFIDIIPEIYGYKVSEGKPNSQIDNLFAFNDEEMFFLSKVEFTHNHIEKYSVTKEGEYQFTYFKPSCQKVDFLRKAIREKLESGDYHGVVPLHKKLVNSYKQHTGKLNLDYVYTLTLMILDQIFQHKIIVGEDTCEQLFETIIKHEFGPIKLAAFKAASNSLTYLIKSLPYLDNYLPTLEHTNFHLQDIQKLIDLSNKPFCLSLNQLIIKSIPYKNTWAILLIKLGATTQKHSQIIEYILKSHKWFDCKQVLNYLASLSEVTSRNSFIKNIQASELQKYILKCKQLKINIKMDILIDNLIQKSQNKISLDIVSLMFQEKQTKWNSLYKVIRMCPEAHDMIVNQYLKVGQNESGLLATTYPQLLLVASKSAKHSEMFATFMIQLYNNNRKAFKNIILCLPAQSVPMHSDMYSTIAYYLKDQCNIGGIQGSKLASEDELINIHIGNLLLKSISSLPQKQPLPEEQLYLEWYFCNNHYEFGVANPASKSPVLSQIKTLSENVLNLLKSSPIKSILNVFDRLIKQIQSQTLPLSTKHIYTNQLNAGITQLLGRSITPESLGDILVNNKMIKLIFNSISSQLSDSSIKSKWSKVKQIQWAEKFSVFTTVEEKVKDWEANRAGSKGLLFKVEGGQKKFTMKSTDSSLVSLSKVLIGFNIIDSPQKNNILPNSVDIYGGQNQNSLVRLCSLSQIQDQHFYSFGVKIFGVNFNSLTHRRFASPINILQFRIRQPMLTSISDVFQNPQKNKKTSFYSLSFLSLMGYEQQPTTEPEYTELYSTLLSFLNNEKYASTLRKVLADDYFKAHKKQIFRTMNCMLPNQEIQKLLLAFNSQGEDILESVLSAEYPNTKLIRKLVLSKLSSSNISKVLKYSKSKLNQQILDIIISSIKLSSYESKDKITCDIDELFNIFESSLQKELYMKLISTILTTPTKFQFNYSQIVQNIWNKRQRRQFYPLIASSITSYPEQLKKFLDSGKTQTMIEQLGDNIHSNKDGYVCDGYNEVSLIASLASHPQNRQYFIQRQVPTKVANQLKNSQTLIVKYPAVTMNFFILFFRQTCIQSKCQDSFSQILINLMVALPDISSIHHNYFINNFFFPLINAFRGVAVKFVWRTNQNKYLYQATHILREKPIKGSQKIVQFNNSYYQPSDIQVNRNKNYVVSQNGKIVCSFKDGKCFVNEKQTKFQFNNKKITVLSEPNIIVPSQNVVLLRQTQEQLNHLTNQTLMNLKNVGIFGSNYINSLPSQNSTFEQIYYLPVEMSIEDIAKQINICGYKLSNQAIKSLKVHNPKDHSLVQNSLKLSQILEATQISAINLQINPQDLFAATTVQKISSNDEKHVPFIPQQTIFRSFEKMKGLNKMIKVLTTCVQNWSNSTQSKIWHQYLNQLESYSCFPIFSSIYMNKKQNVGLLFDLLSGLPDKQDSKKWSNLQKSSVKFLYDIVKDVFEVQGAQAIQVRKYAIQNDFYKTMLDRLQLVTKQPKRFKVQVEQEEQEQIDMPNMQKKNSQEEYKQKVVKKKGVGYGNDSSSNQKWDVTGQQQVRKQLSEQILGLLKILQKFLDHKEFVPPQKIVDQSFQSALLPILQSSLRGGSLLQISKSAELFKGQLSFIKAIAKNKMLIPILMQVPKTYQPKQPQSIHALLKVLEGTSNIFISCLTGSVGQKLSEQMAKDIIETFNIVDQAVSNYQIDNIDQDQQKKILQLPLAKKYPLLLKDLRFDYVDMKDKTGKITKHHYASYYTPNHKNPPQKTIRLAQQLADISHALPIDHTNAIFVRCDKERVDYMQALIMGSNGTPYGHGAYLFDIYFQDTYPNGPPKVNLTTTGNGAIRFNPNLYACGKVCLSLLGTWRGNAMENWDAKVSTLLQVLVSIQSIIMSEQIYFNQPGFEHEQGTLQGQKKNEAYANVVRHGNIKYAMTQNLKNPPKGFQNIIRRHFYLKKDQILQQCRKWVKYAQKREASYTGLVSDHNNNWCTQFRKSKTQYKTSLQKAIGQLQIELAKLKQPHANDLKTLNSNSPKKQKKKVKIAQQYKDENIDDVDVTYDKNQINNLKQLDINDQKVKDRWSRYIGAMGIQAVNKQSKANILLFGLGATGVQIAKNIVLSGCKKLTIIDEQLTTWKDLSGQFFLGQDDIGKNRVQACIYKLQQLNHYVKVQNIKFNQDNLQILKSYDVVILTEQSLLRQKLINNYCHQNSIKFIITDCYGPYGQVFNDFGSDFEVIDKNGEETVEVMLQSITNAEEGVVTLLKGQRHSYEDNQAVRITGVKGMTKQNGDSINGTIHKIKIINQFSFKIGNTTEYSAYQVDGLVRNMKLPIKVTFKNLQQSIAQCNIDGNLAFYDFQKSTKNSLLHKCLLTLGAFKQKNNAYPNPWNWEDGQTFVYLLKQIVKDQLKIEQLNYVRQFSYTCSGSFAPLSAFYGGLTAQEAFKAITGKYMPINQFLFTQFTEVIPQLPATDQQIKTYLTTLNYKPQQSRIEGIRRVVGDQVIQAIRKCKVFMIGSGAIGCQLLKNYAMINLSTAQSTQQQKGGMIVVTDPDHIEQSNLNRQFLFRQKHLRKPKSVTAAAAVAQMNKLLKGKIRAKLDRVCETTKDIFSNQFFESLDIVTNALDNVKARQYVDQRCVENKIALLESGTLSSKGHVQTIIPYKTETYGSKNDPAEDGQIPHCTLKMFPEQTLHCVQWARDIFGKTFTLGPKALLKLVQSWKDYAPQSSDLEMLKGCLKMMESRPRSFDQAVFIATNKFFQLYRNDIMQLLYTYPLEAKTKDGKPFWKLPKRPPTPVQEINPQQQLHRTFITSYAVLLCKIFNIPHPNDFRTQNRRTQIAKQASKIKIQSFVPSDKLAKQMASQVDNDQKDKQEKQQDEKKEEGQFQNQTVLFDQFRKMMEESIELAEQIKVTAEQFEKDDDQNGHIDLIYSMANLRSGNYKLDPMDWMTTKLKAGRITPALSTTTSCVAALQTIQLIKYLKKCKLDKMRNTFINLAVPMIQAGQPGQVQKIKVHENLTTNIWERWEVGPFKLQQITVKGLLDDIDNKYGIVTKTLSFLQGSQIYSDLVLGLQSKKEQKEQLFKKSFKSILQTEYALEDVKKFVDMTLVFSVKEQIAKHVPTLRLLLQ